MKPAFQITNHMFIARIYHFVCKAAVTTYTIFICFVLLLSFIAQVVPSFGAHCGAVVVHENACTACVPF